jgi:hypothetical protein
MRKAEGYSRCLLGHDVSHLLPDLLDLGSLRVRRLLELVLAPLGERNAEEPQLVSIGGRHVDGALDGSLRFHPSQKPFACSKRFEDFS